MEKQGIYSQGYSRVYLTAYISSTSQKKISTAQMPIMDCISPEDFGVLVAETFSTVHATSRVFICDSLEGKTVLAASPHCAARIDWIGKGRRQCSISDSASAKAIAASASVVEGEGVLFLINPEAFCYHSVLGLTQIPNMNI